MFKTFFDNFRRLEAPQLHPAMVLRFRLLDLLCALLLLCTVLALLATPARAQSASTIFLTDRNGQIAFPFTPPNRATGGPANINNTAIGQTTPKNGKFLVLEATTSFKSPDGVTCATYAPSGTPAAVDAVFFIETRAYNIVSISAVFSVTAGGASKLQVILARPVRQEIGTSLPNSRQGLHRRPAGAQGVYDGLLIGVHLGGSPHHHHHIRRRQKGGLLAATATCSGSRPVPPPPVPASAFGH
jgi:hypothetical protein